MIWCWRSNVQTHRKLFPFWGSHNIKLHLQFTLGELQILLILMLLSSFCSRLWKGLSALSEHLTMSSRWNWSLSSPMNSGRKWLINRADGTVWHSPRIRTIRTILAFSIISTCGWNRYQMDKTQVLATASWAGIWSSISGRITRQSCKCGSSHRCPDLPHPFSFSWHDLQLQLLNSLHVFSQALLDHFLWRETHAFRWIFLSLSDILNSGSYPWTLWKEGKHEHWCQSPYQPPRDLWLSDWSRISNENKATYFWYSPPKQIRWVGTDGVPQVRTWYRNIHIWLRSVLTGYCEWGAIPLDRLPSWCHSTNSADSSHVFCGSFAKAISSRDSTTRWKGWSRLLKFHPSIRTDGLSNNLCWHFILLFPALGLIPARRFVFTCAQHFDLSLKKACILMLFQDQPTLFRSQIPIGVSA